MVSLCMAWAKIVCTILVLLYSAPEQHQNHTKEFMNEAAAPAPA